MLYVYDSSQRAEVSADMALTNGKVRVATCGVSADTIRLCVRAVVNHGLVLMPSDLAHHTPNVERIKAIAHLIGVRVEQISTWHRRTTGPRSGDAVRTTTLKNDLGRPAVGHAASPDWHAPMAGGQTTTNIH